ncbi:MAG: hypothetical protein P8N56_06100 [Schleiferiaceae bacterium]|nr:hypothetical protein [Schleiferiaceae bacterium]
MSNSHSHSAIIPLAWPEMTARGSEKIWFYLRKMRLIQNINLMVGHAGMVIVEKGEFRYFDFGRYLTPRIMGRARSKETDPKLQLDIIPEWDDQGQLCNFEALLIELEQKKAATHGSGRMFASILYGCEIGKALDYAQSIQEKGFMGYNGLDRKQSNCARFVAATILASLDPKSKEFRRFKYPVTYAPSPYFNVIAGASSGQFIIWVNGEGEWHQRPVGHALGDILEKISFAFRKSKAQQLPPDERIGELHEPDDRASGIPDTATYIGGIGEGAWHDVRVISSDCLQMSRIALDGVVEFTADYRCDSAWSALLSSDEAQLVHDTHFAWLTLANKSTNERHRCHRIF